MVEGIDEIFELVCLDEDNTFWDDGESIDEIKKDLICAAVRNTFEKIKLIK